VTAATAAAMAKATARHIDEYSIARELDKNEVFV
jgi:hypothetical protein